MPPLYTYEGRQFHSEAELKARVAELDLEHSGQTMPKEAREEWNGANTVLDEMTARRERILELARSPRNVESGDGATFRHDWATRTDENPRLRESRDAGLRAVERHQGRLTAQAADRLDGHIRSNDPTGIDARYLDEINRARREAYGSTKPHQYPKTRASARKVA